ncbi:TonB-dependent receptor [Coprobacter tertius]|uniref:TonB-dependent receptor n=1 Tax=Coprobacter tertius TaxID=2944915 RepID=A0ABT1MDY8_9BACT|nr:TonB-dependent receptor [Coprobacter tertius]MCP9610842.1 TonB-dependent receptor [Coprobacter tertius]
MKPIHLCIWILLYPFLLTAQNPSKDTKDVTLHFDHTGIGLILQEIEKQTHYRFSYESTLIDKHELRSIHVVNAKLTETLQKLFEKDRISFSFSGNYIILKKEKTVRHYVISGTISDINSKEILINASLYSPSAHNGTSSNNYGFYSIVLPEGKNEIICSYIGYATVRKTVEIYKDTTLSWQLQPNAQLKEVVVTDKKITDLIFSAQPGKLTLSPALVNKLPAMGGETDLLKTLQLLPGVNGGTEGTAGLLVRGGNIDENLYLIDGTPIYNPNHMMGFFSTFNADAIKNVDFYKGSFPARYGERLSSVTDIRLKDGNSQEYHGNVSVGLISAKANIEGPIVKDKTFFILSARRTYLDLITTPAQWIMNRKKEEKNISGYNFTDINAKITHKLNERNRLQLSLYWNYDILSIKTTNNSSNNFYYDNTVQNTTTDVTNLYKIKYKDHSVMKWGNLVATLNWNNQISNRIYNNTSISYNRYNSLTTYDNQDYFEYNGSVERDAKTNSRFQSGISDWSLKSDFNYYLNYRNRIHFGANYTLHTFKPEVSRTRTASSENNGNKPNETHGDVNQIIGHETSLYAEDEIDLTRKLIFNPGLHFSWFRVQGKNYTSLQPRLSARYLINNKISLKASYAEMKQYIHLLSYSYINMPNDLWVPVTRKIRPMTSRQVSGGIYYRPFKGWEFSVEGYYKVMHNLIEYTNGASFFSKFSNWENKVAMGNGKAYGAEFMLQKTLGKTTGWIGYTLSWSNRQFPGGEINYGQVYPDRYDCRHAINIVMMHKFSERFDISASWVFHSGSRLTVPTEYFSTSGVLPGEIVNTHQSNIPYISSRNNYQLPNYHRLDLSCNFHKKKKRGIATWSIYIYNAYNKLNPVYVNVEAQKNTDVIKPIIKGTCIFPIIPGFSYTFTF